VQARQVLTTELQPQPISGFEDLNFKDYDANIIFNNY
jgi:hypothetical protein